MTAKPRTPFSSASGKTGQSVTIQLLVRGIPTQAFVRRIDVCSERFADSGAEIFEGDHCDISDIPRATGFSQKMMSQALRAHPPSRPQRPQYRNSRLIPKNTHAAASP